MADEYEFIIVESFLLENTSGHRGDIHIRPAANQVHPQHLMVQHNKKMVDTSLYPVGTKFRWKVRLVTKQSGTQFLGSHHAWPFDVVTDEEFERLYPSKVTNQRQTIKQNIALQPKVEKPLGSQLPNRTLKESAQFLRNDSVRSWVLRNACGICECCEQPAPFDGLDGLPYLEVHHVRHMAKGGSDTLTNAVAVCPNCHRELHHGLASTALIKHLYKTVSRLVKE